RQVMAKIDKVEREVDLKSSLKRLATVVSDMVDSLNWNLDIKMFSFSPIQIATDEVIRFIHDKGERESVLNAEAVSIRISFSNGVGREETGKIETVKEFERLLRLSSSVTSALVNFRFTPNIITHDSIELTDYIKAMKGLYRSWDELSKHRDLLGSFDHSILDYLAEDIILPMVHNPIHHFTSNHEIKLRWLDKSDDIHRKLLEELCGYETIANVINNRRDVALERFQKLQKSILLEAK
ncbi:MAG: hypothetical protein O7B30_00465, partial [Thaumarchaeota archaeon]|nr:hypothetical protein [Nitrososphaerota archaeon]